MSEFNSMVAIYDRYADVEAAVRRLQIAGFDMSKLSVAGKESHDDEHIAGCHSCRVALRYWGRMGAFWQGARDILNGAGFFVVPGLGPILIAGPLVRGMISGLELAITGGGLSLPGAALYVLGIPRNSVVRYDWSLRADKVLLVGHGTQRQLLKAKDVLGNTQPDEVSIHCADENPVSA
jgi:hypothetical protein